MIFNSLEFSIFFLVFFLLYWFIFNSNVKIQNLLLLISSYFFYAWWDWRFLFLIVGSSVLNYILGILIERTSNLKYRRMLVYTGLLQGIGGLAYFKYFNFFITSFNEVFQSLDINGNLQTLNIIIPLGISFFTFRTISYVLDIDSGKIKATRDWIVFFNYISFFPTLISGPIDKAKSFIPQLKKQRVFNYDQAIDGMRQILWGLFKKIVIADNCAAITNPIFNNYQELPGSSLLLGAFIYTIQIYADFSGYSDMAIGFSRLIGFNVTKNFDYPFFAQNIADFWRKWHISLTAWMTEYVFTPFSFLFRDLGKIGLILAILINFTIIGIWHGANWTYVLFGFIHGLYFIPLVLSGKLNKKKIIAKDTLFPSYRETLNVLGTFTLVMLTMVLFRANTIGHAFYYFNGLFSKSLFSVPDIPSAKFMTLITFLFIVLMFIIEWIGRKQEHAIANISLKWNTPMRWVFYYALILSVFWFGGQEQQFIYLQF